MESSLPKKTKSALGTGAGKKLEIIESDLPQPGEGEVLIKVAYSSINPADYAAIAGMFPTSKDPNDFIPGLEGSGTIVQVGDKVSLKVGTKVVFFAHNTHKFGGAWTEYSIQRADWCIELPPDFDLKLGASPIVNPLTVHGIIHEIKDKGFKAVVFTAAGSAVGRMLIKICKTEEIKTINIVRKPEAIPELKAIGGDIVLNSSDPAFKDQFKKAVDDLQPNALFDCLFSDLTLELFKELPKYSFLYLYGRLGGTVLKEITFELILRQFKTITYFSILQKFEAAKSLVNIQDIKRLPELLITRYTTTFIKEYGLNEINEALDETKKLAGHGKVLINLQKH